VAAWVYCSTPHATRNDSVTYGEVAVPGRTITQPEDLIAHEFNPCRCARSAREEVKIAAYALVLDRFVRDLTQRHGDAECRSTPGKPHGLVWVGSHHSAPACSGLCRPAGSEERAFHLHTVDLARVSDSGVRHR